MSLIMAVWFSVGAGLSAAVFYALQRFAQAYMDMINARESWRRQAARQQPEQSQQPTRVSRRPVFQCPHCDHAIEGRKPTDHTFAQCPSCNDWFK